MRNSVTAVWWKAGDMCCQEFSSFEIANEQLVLQDFVTVSTVEDAEVKRWVWTPRFKWEVVAQ
jgi:hypothetical protein